MVPPSRAGSFSPNPAQSLSTATGHTQNPPFGGAFSANASPSTNSPTGSNPLVKIVVAQVYLLLSTIKHDDKTKREAQVDQLRKLLDEHGMEVFSKYFTRLVASCAAQVFGLTRPAPNPGNYHLLAEEMQKISHDLDQAGRIAEAIESGTDDIFRDFDLSTFMEHFKLDALEKTILALAFKMGSKPDLKAKADAILSANFPNFVNIIARPDWENHTDMDDSFVARIVDRFIQYQPPNFNAASKSELNYKVQARWNDQAPPPSEVLAALDMVRILADKPPNALAIYIQRTGLAFTADVESCLNFLQSRPSNVHLTEEQVSVALTYTTISHNPVMDSGVLVMALRRILPSSFRWQDVVAYFDQRSARISSHQFLRLYNALLPVAQADPAAFNIELLWGGNWENPETQLSFICAFASLSPEQLDASTIPGLRPTLTLDAFEHSPPDVKERAAYAVRHPLVSVAALAAVFHVALHSVHASQSAEAKRLFQEVVVPNLDIFVVSAFGVPKPWPPMAMETLNSLFDNFLYKRSDEYDFVLDSLWKKDRGWVTQRLVDAHAVNPTDLPLIYEHAVKHKWLDDLVSLTSGFGLDLAAYAHAQGVVNLAKYARDSTDRTAEVARSLQQFLLIKANLELQYQRPVDGQPIVKSTTLQVRTVAALLQILEDFMPKAPVQDLILVQRSCITVYPRLINYNEGLDDIIDSNGANGNALSPAANSKMEEHYKKMYSDEIQVRNIVDILHRYKHSRDPLDQDVFACMIHGLFDEYAHYVDYPLEALATTAVLFGGIISHKLIADLPLKIGLGMILEAVRDYPPDVSMFKFGLQALMQIFSRLREWPGFCKQLLQVPGLQGTEAWKKAEDVVREHEEELARSRNGTGTITPHGSYLPSDNLANGTSEDARPLDRQPQAFASIRADDPVPDMDSQEPNEDVQGKVQFVLNNLTETTLQSMCQELRDILEQRHKQWFAGHLVEERAKMQPNYHQVYLELVKLFEDKVLWSEVLRETYVSVSRMLNSEVTISNATERGHLKNLGGWLGLLTLARDKPIKHRNIAFKQLLLEAHDTKRLVLVIPFVCKVLIQGASSTVFRPPNPWLMDIIHLLIELYHNAELKLNLKFEIEVLCKGLNLDHKSITPSSEILNRVTAEESAEIIGHEALDTFENLSMNGITAGIPGGLSPQVLPASIPDIKEDIQIPPTNEMVIGKSQLESIVSTALTRALQDIIQPVVDRSVTIAAISTREMIRKDFATEPDETRIRTSAISMVKATAGSLALVTSKEPLRGNFTNYLRNLANDLPQGLPEGTIIMCVNSNLDLACKIIEKQAEERAVPEIEEMIEPELEARRRHRAQRPNEPYVDPSLSRWAWTIPNPFKLSPNVNGLNPEQMAIYEDFARQPRSGPTNSGSHLPSASDATRSIANDVLSDQFSNVPSLPTPAETPTAQHLGSHMASYTPLHSSTVANGRQPGHPIDARALYERSRALLQQLQSNAANAPDEHFADLPRGHIVLEIVDALGQHMIKTSQTSEDVAALVADQIISDMFQSEDALFLECLAQVLETLRRISGPVLNNRVASHFIQQPGASFLRLPLISALLRTDLLDWRGIDSAMSKMLQQKKDGSLEFLEQLLILTIWAARPVVMFSDFSRSLEAAWTWIHEDTTTAVAQRLKQRLSASPSSSASASAVTPQRDQMEYVFEEWVHIHDNPDTSDDYAIQFLRQMQAGGILNSKEDLFLFTRTAIDVAVDKFEQLAHNASSAAEAFRATDALARLVALCIRLQDDDQTTSSTSRTTYVDSILALLTLVLSHHHLRRGEHFNQKVFHRLFSVLFYEIATLLEEAGEDECSATSIKMASRLADLSPRYLPGFAYGWLALIQHRRFLPIIMRDRTGWVAYSKLLRLLFEFVGDQLKLPDPSFVARDAYRATLKLLVVLQHDFPEYLASQASHLILCLPLHCKQLINAILAANPSANLSDPLSTGLQADQIEETRETLTALEKSASVLRDAGLLEILEQALGSGPTEDIVAYITRAMSVASHMDTGFANVPVRANLAVIEAVTSFVGKYGLDQLATTDDAFNDRGPQVQLVIMLLHELMPEPRYYFIAGMVNQLRCPSAWTTYFSRLILQVFGHDMNDPEENEIREQVTRVLMERLIGYWPQPWGLMVTTMELLKNEKYMFFDLPFVKSSPEVVDRFSAIIQRA